MCLLFQKTCGPSRGNLSHSTYWSLKNIHSCVTWMWWADHHLQNRILSHDEMQQQLALNTYIYTNMQRRGTASGHKAISFKHTMHTHLYQLTLWNPAEQAFWATMLCGMETVRCSSKTSGTLSTTRRYNWALFIVITVRTSDISSRLYLAIKYRTTA
jgi:hypothetical protein